MWIWTGREKGGGHHRQGAGLSKGLGGGGESEHKIGKERSGRQHRRKCDL